MKRLCCALSIGLGLLWGADGRGADGVPGHDDVREQYRKASERIVKAAVESSVGFDRLATMCDRFGPRFSGSANLEQAIDWILETMEADGLEAVRGEPVSVPRWVRGSESLSLLSPRFRDCPVLGLGGSVGTPASGIEGEVMVVGSFEELTQRASEAAGKIVLFNVPFTEYRQTRVIRSRGAIEAAKVGAVASLIRSVGPFSMQTPHTGAMSYEDGVRQIPHAAITAEDAQMMQRMSDRGESLVVRLKMSAPNLGE